MTINFQVLCSFIEYMIRGNVKSTLIVTIDQRSLGTFDVHIIYEIYEPLELRTGYCKGFIFNF